MRGSAPVRAVLEFTRHGPVLHRTATKLYAIRSVWSEPGTAPYAASLRYLTSTSLGDFEQSLDFWRTPPVNQVCADKSGNIGWILAASHRIRTRHDGLLPVPGDGRFEWQGFMPSRALPRALSPERGLG